MRRQEKNTLNDLNLYLRNVILFDVQIGKDVWRLSAVNRPYYRVGYKVITRLFLFDLTDPLHNGEIIIAANITSNYNEAINEAKAAF